MTCNKLLEVDSTNGICKHQAKSGLNIFIPSSSTRDMENKRALAHSVHLSSATTVMLVVGTESTQAHIVVIR
jgi:hypothetical protein